MPSKARVGPLLLLKFEVRAEIYPKSLENFMFPSADKLCGDAFFAFFDHGTGVLDGVWTRTIKYS